MDTESSCCAPGRSADVGAQPRRAHTDAGARQQSTASVPSLDLIELPGGSFTMGTDASYRWHADGEGPARVVTVGPFRIGRDAITNAEFAAFAESCGYVTDAERFEASFVFAGLLPEDFPPTRGVVGAQWWREVIGADWAHPFGPQSSLTGLQDHPVVHISHNDANAFCAWAGVRLPTEAEWEYAARGGLDQKRFVWGDDFDPEGQPMCNIFDGDFPNHTAGGEGTLGTAPVGTFPPNGYGLHNMAGNVWEWCADWFATSHQTTPLVDPTGPATGSARVIRGGSYLCHDSYCDRYRVSARSSNAADSSTGNMGFRVVAT